MAQYKQGDYIKAEFRDERSSQSEWMWVKVQSADDSLRVVFGILDSEPIVNRDLCLGMELAIGYDSIREHIEDASFDQ